MASSLQRAEGPRFGRVPFLLSELSRSECLNDHADLHTLTAAYALDALPEHELLLFELHLVACPACREEVEDLAAAVVELATSQPIQAPAAMRFRVLGLLASIPQS